MAVPVGYTPSGRPVGRWLAAGFMQEPTLIRLGFAIEQLLHARVTPPLSGAVPPDPTPFPGRTTAAAASSATAAMGHAGMVMHARHW